MQHNKLETLHLGMQLVHLRSHWAIAMSPAAQRKIDGRLATIEKLARHNGAGKLANDARRDRRQLRRELARCYTGRQVEHKEVAHGR